MQLDDYNIDITECWLDSHFRTLEDRFIYRMFIRKIVKENAKGYWDDNGYLSFLADRVIKHMAKKDYKPFFLWHIHKAITEAFYNTHGDYELRSAGIRRRKKKKNKR